MEDGQTSDDEIPAARVPAVIRPFDRQTTLAAALFLAAGTGRAFSWQHTESLTTAELDLVGWFAALCDASTQSGASSFTFQPGRPASKIDRVSETPGITKLSLGRGAMSSLFFVLAALGLSRQAGSLRIQGGTHTDEGLAFEHLVNPLSWLLERVGLTFELRLKEAGYGSERGVVEAQSISTSVQSFAGLRLERSGELGRIEVAAAASGLANHLHQRQASEAAATVRSLGVPVSVHLMKLRARQSGSVVSVRGWRGAMPVVSTAGGGLEAKPEQVGKRAATAFLKLVSERGGFPESLMPHALVVLALAKGPSQIVVEAVPAWWPEIQRFIGCLTDRIPLAETSATGCRIGLAP